MKKIKKDTKTFFAIWAVIIIIIGIIYLFVGNFSNNMNNQENNMNTQENSMMLENNPAFNGNTKIINVEAFKFGFKPNVIKVKYGDKVILTAKSLDVPHGFAIQGYPEVNLYLDGINSDSINFIADKRGSFTFYCNVPCGEGHGKMRGTFIVE